MASSANSGQYQGDGVNQGQHGSVTPGQNSWSSTSGSLSVSWNSYGTENGLTGNAAHSSSGIHYGSHVEMSVPGDVKDGVNSVSNASTSLTGGAANVNQHYTTYAPYSNSPQPYTYNNMDYQNYYGYQQPASSSSSQQVGACQNSGAPYQSFSSFQHTGSYVAPTSYSGTYYNAGDHQTAAGYPNGSYADHSNYWNDRSCANYAPHQYSNYTSLDTNSTQTTSTFPASSLHHQQYGHWPYYHSPSVSAVSSASGTESTLATSVSTPPCPVQAASGGYPYPSNQPPPPGTTAWRRDSGSPGLPALQDKSNATTYNANGTWLVAAPGFQSYQTSQMSPHFEKPLDSNSAPPEKCEGQQKTIYSQGLSSQPSSANQVSEHFQPPLQTATMLDTRRVSKMQIPTNPRIASSLALSMSKVDKDSSTTDAAIKPAYISVSVPKPSNKLPANDDAEAIMKGTFPTSVRAYVERTFARCKDDSQRASNQNLMKEIITKASADGTLFTKNWDIEPLFPLPNSTSDAADQNHAKSSVTVPILPKLNRRAKSRWEPIADDKLAEKVASARYDMAKDARWDQLKGAERVVDSRKFETKDINLNGIEFLSAQQQTSFGKIIQRPGKKPRLADITDTTENGDFLSDSDVDQGLTKYYSSAIALANTPEEKKKREHRYKRFEKGQKGQTEIKHYRPNMAGAGTMYTRRATAMLLAKNCDDSCSRAVEDIDWNALTVKGTCQEVEKRYLRLTSAPDPATVRPEEVLEKALHMVQNCQKNYLYKCDQLKSIRQDLTVQRIQNELTVKVYETHARLALEAGDLPEYNQCQSQLKSLYAEGIKGCHMEFAAYNLLCVILHSNNNRDLLSAMTRLSKEAKEDETVKHALAVRSAVSTGNYILFFRLYKTAPNLSTCLMDLYVEKMRFEAIKCIAKSYRPTVPVAYIAHNLGFSRVILTENTPDIDNNGLVECQEWLRAHGAVLSSDNNGEFMDTKASSSSLYMPEPEDAVAHGDSSLAVDDFLTRTAL